VTPAAGQHGWAQTLLPLAIAAVVLLFRARRMARSRPLRLERLWIVPALYLLVVAALFVAQPPSAQGWGAAALGLLVGTTLGWQRGKAMLIAVDPDTHALTQRSSPMAFVLLAALIGLRQFARLEGSSLGFDLALVTDGLAALALGLLSSQRLEMFLRGRRLLAEARISRPPLP
jgi:hypothetical protein